MAGIEKYDSSTNTFSLNDDLSGTHYTSPEALKWRKKKIDGWNKGARWSLVAIEENNKRTVLGSFMDHNGKEVKV